MRFGNGRLLVGGELVEGYALRTEGRRIAGVERSAAWDVDLQGGILAPGFVELHMHGMVGRNVTEGREALAEIAAALPRYGVTTVLPAATGNREQLLAFLEAVKSCGERPPVGAAIPGCNLEGPFLNPQQRGAIPEEAILPPDRGLLGELLAAGCVRLMTMAPDLPGIGPLIETAAAAGVTVSLGHTRATLEQALTAQAQGASHVTHLFNGMQPLHHRQPGMVGAALTAPGLTVELIADLVHVHAGALRLAIAAKGAARCVLITDAMAALGMPNGVYSLLGREVRVRGQEARLEDGTLAGSTLSLDQALRNVTRAVGVPLAEALGMVTENPARQARLADRGRLAPGLRADLVWLGPDLQVRGTWVEGERMF